MTLEELYREYPLGTKLGNEAQRLIFQTNWFLNALEFDPVTGEALPMALSEFLTRILRDSSDDGLHDRLWKIVDYSEESFRRIVRGLNEQPRTEHSRMHISRVREMDASSFMKLANRTGRTIREKLAVNPYVTSVRHFQSIDLAENQLLKAYATRLEELLSEREKAFDRPEPFLIDIRKWLRTDEARSISRWNNIPPNNVLLAHRDYRRIWNAWRWLQALDDDIESDRRALQRRQNTMEFWNRAAAVFSNASALMADIPLKFSFDEFKVETFDGLGLNFSFGKNYAVKLDDLTHMPDVKAAAAAVELREESEPVCIDLFPIEPILAAGKSVKRFGQKLVWQKWDCQGDTLDIVPLPTKGVWLSDSALTVTAEDLFVAGEKPTNALGSAARSFCSAIKRRIPSAGLAWLVPDCANDFDLSELRRAVNSHYREAVPVPRSIATVYQELGRDIVSGKVRDGMSVVVIDMVGTRVFATRLVARAWGDDELRERVPQTGGFFWVRQPIIELGDERGGDFSQLGMIATLDAQRRWVRSREDIASRERVEIMQRYAQDARFAKDRVIILGGSPVVGGLKLAQYQKRAGGIPLWRDILPDLSIGAPTSTGEIVKVALVSPTTSDRDIVPIPGYERIIKIDDNELVTLPAGKSIYRFKVFQGTGSGQLRYCAVVSCPQVFPHPQNIRCMLELKYTYGANDPYTLHLRPINGGAGFPAYFDVEWRLISADDVEPDSINPPGFPFVMPWRDCEHYKTRKGEENLVETLKFGVDQIEQYLKFLRGESSVRKTQVLTGNRMWQEDETGRQYFSVSVNGEHVRFYQCGVLANLECLSEISFDIKRRRCAGGYRPRYYYEATEISVGHTLPDRPQLLFRRLRVPMSKMFAVCRDDEMPARLGDVISRGLKVCSELLNSDGVPQAISDEVLLFLSYFTDLTSCQVFPLLLSAIRASKPLRFMKCRKSVGVALGGLDLRTQDDMLKLLLPLLQKGVRWSSPVLEALSIAFWRDEVLVRRLSADQIRSIAVHFNPVIRYDITRIAETKDMVEKPWELKKSINTLRAHLELVLALLRARGKNDVEVKKILRPNGRIAQMFEQTIDDHVMPLLSAGVHMVSNLELNVNKPPVYRNTPDLIYALKMHLTGDSGADSIVIERNAGGE